jgi:hypothetical protein
MTSREWRYSLTFPSNLGRLSAMSRVSITPEWLPCVGTYENGLLTVLDEVSGASFLRSWSWLVGEGCVALLSTGFGDVFFWGNQQVSWLNVQRGTVEPVDPDIHWFLEEFLANEGVLTSVLRTDELQALVQIQRPLEYLEAFILRPWLILGGVDSLEHYEIGHCGVYVDLVGQTHSQIKISAHPGHIRARSDGSDDSR